MNQTFGSYPVLSRSFYARDPATVAKELLGKALVRSFEDQLLAGRIIDTEAYLASNDPAAHNYIGKTKRNAILYGQPGYAYVHSMRQYCLLDVVTEAVDQPSSVLIRALEPLTGIESMRAFRRSDDLDSLTNGPGKVCQALHIDRIMNGIDMTSQDCLYIVDLGQKIDLAKIKHTTRIGISKGTDSLLRFFV